MTLASQGTLFDAADLAPRNGAQANRLSDNDRSAHDWYRFILSFPPHLVRHYIQDFGLGREETVLDPFCGTGTTLVECRKLGIPCVGVEPHPMSHFASSVKLDWTPDPRALVDHANQVAEDAAEELDRSGLPDDQASGSLFKDKQLPELRTLPPDAASLLLGNSISPLPLHRALVLLDKLNARRDSRFAGHERLALAKALVSSIGNLHFGPEVGVGDIKTDAPAIEPWLAGVRAIASDLEELRRLPESPAVVHKADSRDLLRVLQPRSVDAVITSPPYPNEKDYTRTTRLESVLLGFLTSKKDLRDLKRTLMRSNTRNVYKGDDDDSWVADDARIQAIAGSIEARRIELGKTSGFERMYHRVTKLYFGGMKRHLSQLAGILRPGARLAYVVGDQASFLRVMIRTGELLADIAASLGYEVLRIDLFRTRMATATRAQLREEVLVLRWPGKKRRRGTK